MGTGSGTPLIWADRKGASEEMTLTKLRSNGKKNPIMCGSGRRVFQAEGTATAKAGKESHVLKHTKEDQRAWNIVRGRDMERPDHVGPCG